MTIEEILQDAEYIKFIEYRIKEAETIIDYIKKHIDRTPEERHKIIMESDIDPIIINEIEHINTDFDKTPEERGEILIMIMEYNALIKRSGKRQIQELINNK